MKTKFALFASLLVVCFLIDITFGGAAIPFQDVWATITGNGHDVIYNEIIFNHRIPRALTAILTGTALSLSGVMMQTLFHNPLAGPMYLALLRVRVSALPFLRWEQVFCQPG